MYFDLILRKQKLKYISEKFEIQIIYSQVAIYQFCLNFMYYKTFTFRHRFHEVAALRALMRAARPLRENGNDL